MTERVFKYFNQALNFIDPKKKYVFEDVKDFFKYFKIPLENIV